MDVQILAHQTNTYWAILRDIKAAEKVGDVTEQEYLHAELEGLAISAESPTLRTLAGKAINREMSDASAYRGFMEQIVEHQEAGDAEGLERMLFDFAEFGRETTNPTVRKLVAETLQKHRNIA